MSDELEALTGEAAAVDALNAPAPVTGAEAQAEPVTVTADRTAEAALLLAVGKPLLLMIPYLKDAPDSEFEALQEPIAGLLDYYAVDVGAWLNNPWAKLGAAAIPLAMRGVSAWSEDTKKPKQKPAIAQVEPVPVTVGQPSDPMFAQRG